MSARLRTTSMFIALALLLASGAVADPSAIPPDPAAVQAELAAGEGLSGAIGAAEKAAGGGEAVSASFDSANKQIVVTVARADGMFSTVTISTTDGDILNIEERGRFPGDPVSGDWTETDSGLKYYDIVVGDGETPA
ncbi:hypothetical protein DRQ53_07860, partial [bacterium]